jgi:hypothetical protein
MYRIASIYLLHRIKGSMSGDVRDFNNNETPAVIMFFYLKTRRQSERNIMGTCTNGCHRKKLRGPI